MIGRMTYFAKLAIFPPWKAPIPYKTLDEEFATLDAARGAAERILRPIMERELAELSPQLQPQKEPTLISIAVPPAAVHGFVIYDGAGVEVANWTTLDEALERLAKD